MMQNIKDVECLCKMIQSKEKLKAVENHQKDFQNLKLKFQKLCAIDLFSKYAWVVPKKDKKESSIVNAFQKIISKGTKPNKIWVDQGSEFYNHSFKDFLKISNIEMYSTYNEGKSVVAKRFIRTLKNKI